MSKNVYKILIYLTKISQYQIMFLSNYWGSNCNEFCNYNLVFLRQKQVLFQRNINFRKYCCFKRLQVVYLLTSCFTNLQVDFQAYKLLISFQVFSPALFLPVTLHWQSCLSRLQARCPQCPFSSKPRASGSR
jgi:hypothetical protein